MIVLVTSVVMAVPRIAGDESMTVYDPVHKRNFLLAHVTQDRLGELLTDRPAGFTLWSDVDKLQAAYERRQALLEGEVLLRSNVTAENVSRAVNASTVERFADELGVTMLFDPYRRSNRAVERLSRDEFICYVNNPVTRRVSFPGEDPVEFRQRLEALGIYAPMMTEGRKGKQRSQYCPS